MEGDVPTPAKRNAAVSILTISVSLTFSVKFTRIPILSLIAFLKETPT